MTSISLIYLTPNEIKEMYHYNVQVCDMIQVT